MIRMEQVSFSYGGRNILDNLSISFHPHKLISLIGPNGSGKSTILKLCAGLLRPCKGHVLINNCPVSQLKPTLLAKQITMLPQHFPTANVPVEDLVSYGRYPYQGFLKRLSPKDWRIVEEKMAVCRCLGYRKQGINTLSGGQRQRAYLAMILAQDTGVVLLDEPIGALDISVSYEILGLIQSIVKQEGKTIIMVLHDLSHAFRYSDEIMLIENSRVVYYGQPQQKALIQAAERVFQIKTQCVEVNGKKQYIFEPKNKGSEYPI